MSKEPSEAVRAGDPAITVVIPTFNRSRWLPEAIESVLRQTHPDFRLVVSDNASTDGTPEVVRQFTDPRISYVRRDTHLDLNPHFNLCLGEVETDYVLALPDDDLLLPDALAVTLEVLDANPRVGLVHGRARNIDESGRTIADAHDMTGLGRDCIETGDEFIRASMAGSYRVHASTALIRTEALSGLALDPRDHPATDFGLWLRLATSWDIAFVARTLAAYRIHDTSYTATSAAATPGGYVQGAELIEKVRDVKFRFIAEAEQPHPRALRRLARRAMRRELINQAARTTLPERALGPTLLALADCARRDPVSLIMPQAIRLLGGSILGPANVDRIRRMRATKAVAQ